MNQTIPASRLKRLILPIAIFLLLLVPTFYLKITFAKFDLVELFSSEYISYILGSALWLTFAWLIVATIDALIWNKLFLDNKKVKIPQLLKNFIAGLIFFLALLGIISNVFNHSINNLLATSGVVSIVLGFALKEVIANIFNGMMLNLDQTFKIGDIVQLQGNINRVGKVLEITWRNVRFESNGNLLIIPNNLICSIPFINLTGPYKKARMEIAITITHRVPPERARRLLLAAASYPDIVLKTPEPTVSISNIDNNGITYLMLFWVATHEMSPYYGKSLVYDALIKQLNSAGIIYHLLSPTSFITEQDYSTQASIKLNNLLAKTELFANLQPEELQQLSVSAIRHFIPKDSTFIQTGEAGSSMYFIAEGLLKVKIANTHTNRLFTVAKLTTGDYFGERSLLLGEPRSASIIAKIDTIVYELTKDALNQLIEKRPEIITALSNTLANRQLANDKQLSERSIKDQAQEKTKVANQLFSKIKSWFSN